MTTTDYSDRRSVELSIVGSMALSPMAAEWAASELQAAQFAYSDCGVMFATICAMTAAGTAIDPLTLAGELTSRGLLEQAGGAHGIWEVLNAVPHAEHVAFYGGRLIEFHNRDQLKALGERLRLASEDSTADPSSTIDAILGELEAIRAGNLRQADLITAAEAVEAFEQRSRDLASVIPTGLAGLDRLLGGGLRSGQLVVCGGRPGLGKSALMGQFILHAGRHRRQGLIASLEMTAAEIAGRGLRTIDRERFAQLPVWFAEESDFAKLTGRIRLAKRRHGIQLVAVDYLQLMESPRGRNDLREQQVARMSRGLKRLAMELQIPILLGSQLNRDSEKRGRPSLADLRESGAIEQDADIVILINGDAEEDERELIVAKHRGGPCGMVRTEFDRPHFVFRDPPEWQPSL